jgi:hypothetical protein
MEDYSYGESKIQVRKDYKEKSFSNPYFDRFKRGFNTKLYLKILLLVFLVYVFIYSDCFRIKNVEITGTDLIPQKEIQSVVGNYLHRWTFFLVPKNNLIILNKGAIKNEILKKYSVESIEVKRGWQSLKINIKEKICYLILFNQKNYYYIGLDGTVIKQLSADDVAQRINQLPTININYDINTGDKVFSDKKINYILSLDEKLREQKLKPKSYEDRGVMEMTAVFSEGWQAYFDTEADIGISVDNLKLILNTKVKDRKALQYVDLRMGDKIYYK